MCRFLSRYYLVEIIKEVIEMKRFYLFFVIAVTGILIFAGNGNAAPLPNPDPSVFGDDLDDPGLFIPSDLVVNFEVFDPGTFLGLGGNTFGFFFDGMDVTNPANLFTIFDPSDQDTGSIPQIALIDFSAGIVYDYDDGSSVTPQDTFTGAGNIGFYLTPDPALGIPTLFTVPSLNLGGEDFAGTFPFLGPPEDDFLIAFEIPDGSGGFIPLGFEVTAGISPVPAPGTLLLLGSGLVGLVGYSRKRVKRRTEG